MPLPSLVPKDRVFFRLFAEAGTNSVRAARLLKEMIENWPDDGALAREILLAEQEGDRITHEIIHVLGFGTLWSDRGFIADTGSSDPRYTGPRAREGC